MGKIVTPPKRFVGLHAHSGFSTYDGLGYPKEHMDFVLENGMDAWALTDHGHMNAYSHAQFHQWELDKKGRQFKYIPGVEFYLHPDLDEWRDEYVAAQQRKAANKHVQKDSDDDSAGSVVENEDETKRTKWYDPVRRRHHLVVLAKSRQGLENLFALVSKSYSDGFYRFPRIDYKMLKEHGEGLVVSTACLGGPMAYEIMRHHQDLTWEQMIPGAGNKNTFEAIQRDLLNVTDRITDCVGRDNFFLELQFNKLGPQHLVNMHLIELSKRTDVPLIATADSHYPDPNRWKDREMYKKLGWLSNDKFEPGILPQSVDELECELYPKNAEQMWQAYKDGIKTLKERHPEAKTSFYDDQLVADAIERTYDIAHDLIGDTSPDTSVKLPSYVVEDGEDHFNALVKAVKQGLKERGLDQDKEYIERAKMELDVIKEKEFSLYFLTMKSIMDVATENMLVGPGRGCFLGDTEVLTPEGVKRIDEITVGNQVYDADTNVGDVVEVFQYDVDEDLIELEFDDGTAVRCTQDHKFLTHNRGWVAACDLNDDDDIVEVHSSTDTY